mgnify:CR=1 FL=1
MGSRTPVDRRNPSVRCLESAQPGHDPHCLRDGVNVDHGRIVSLSAHVSNAGLGCGTGKLSVEIIGPRITRIEVAIQPCREEIGEKWMLSG